MIGRILAGWAEKVQLKEMQAFVDALRVSDKDEIALLVAQATDWRHRLSEMGMDVSDPFQLQMARPDASQVVLSMIRALQKNGSPQQAAGLMVWLHSLRATFTMPLRGKAREMWGELARGFPLVLEMRGQFYRDFRVLYEVDGYEEFPSGLTPTPK